MSQDPVSEGASGVHRTPASKKTAGLSKRDVLILAATLILCAAAMWYFFKQSADITGPVEMGIHGWIALGIGVTVSMVVGVGLMALVFFSARNGYDDRISQDDDFS
jgi:uncharacterized protein involved in cysteine biosynthesis